MKKVSWFRICFDVLTLLLLLTAMLLLITIAKPFQSGFYCDDYSVNLAFKENTVTNLYLILISLALPVCVIILTEITRFVIFKVNSARNSMQSKHQIDLCCCKTRTVPNALVNLYANVGLFLFGLLANDVITNVGKITIGRLRPNFLSVCKPLVDPYKSACLTKSYVIPGVDFECGNANLREVQGARKSFPSGHSSLSFYGMVKNNLIFEIEMSYYKRKY
jgi:phosphatidate phosphatase